MFQVKDLVVFGTHGICEIKAIGSLSMSGAAEDRLYYTLKPLYEAQQSAVYTPVDSEKSPIRASSTREEAQKIMDQIPEIQSLWIDDDRQREEMYKNVMKKNECTGWIQIIKTLYLKKQLRLDKGKKNTTREDFYLKLAEDLLYGELAVALEADRVEVKDMIETRIKDADDNLAEA